MNSAGRGTNHLDSRKTDLAIFVAALLITEIGRRAYRPYAYSHGLHDLGLADTVGNFGGVVTIVFFDSFLGGWTRARALCLTWLLIVPGMVLYEFLQGNLLRGTFDWGDVAATILGGIAATFIIRAVHDTESPTENDLPDPW